MSRLKSIVTKVNKIDELVALLRASLLPTLVVESGDDVRIYSRWIERRLFGTYKLDVLAVDGKGNLLSLYERRNEFADLPVVFAANQGIWLFSRIPEGYEDIICTQGYSIENDVYLCLEGRTEKLLDPYLNNKDGHKSVQKSIIRWLAFELEKFIRQTPSEGNLSLENLMSNDKFELEELVSGLSLEDLVPKGHTELDKSFCVARGFDWPGTQIAEEISRKIGEEYRFYLPGKLLFEMLDRFSMTSLHALYNIALTDYESKQQSFIQEIKKKLDEQGFISSKRVSPAPQKQNLVPSTPLGEYPKIDIEMSDYIERSGDIRSHPSIPPKESTLFVNYLVGILKSSSLPTIVVAGKENAKIIKKLVKYHKADELLGGKQVQVDFTRKNTLLSAYERRNEFIHILPVSFVADQEMELFTGISERYTNVIWTRGYSLKNDLYADANLETLLEPHEVWRHQQVLNSTIEWFAFEVEEFLRGKSVEMDFNLSKIVREGELKLDKNFCQARGFRQPSSKLVQQIRDGYQFLLPGDFLFQVLARFLNIRGRDFNFNIANRSLYDIALEMHDFQYQSVLYTLMQEVMDQLENQERRIYKRNQTSNPQNAQSAKLLGKLTVKVGDRVNATILKKDNIKVTVQLQTDYKEVVTFEYPDYPGKVRDKVELKVINIDDTGRVGKAVPLAHKVNATILKKDSIKVTVQLQTGYKEEIVFEHPYYPGKVGAEVKLRVVDTDDTGRVIKVVP